MKKYVYDYPSRLTEENRKKLNDLQKRGEHKNLSLNEIINIAIEKL